MESAQQFTEPHRIVSIVMTDFFLYQMVQQGNAKSPGGSHPKFGIGTGGQDGVGDTVFVVLHLLKGKREDFRKSVIVIGFLEAVAHKGTDGIKKVGMDNNIPMFAGVAFFPVEAVYIGEVQKNHITGAENMALSVEGVGNRAFQNIKEFVKLMAMNNIIAVFRNF